MPRAQDVDQDLRRRLCAWVRYYVSQRGHEYPRQEDFAKHVKIAQSTVSGIMSRDRNVGLDVLVKLHRALHVSLDVLVDTDPPMFIHPSPKQHARPLSQA